MIQLVMERDLAASVYLEPGRKRGDTVWVRSEKIARELVEGGHCKLPGDGKSNKWDGKTICRRGDSWPLDRFAVVERVWKDETVVCLGGGPSLSVEQVERCRGRVRVIAINNSYLLAPWADVCYFADGRWWEWHKDKQEFRDFAGIKVTIMDTGAKVADPAVFILRNQTNIAGSSMPLSLDQRALQTGSNSGYQSINLAVLSGAKRIVLLGYDMRFIGGRSHWHKGHPEANPERVYHRCAERFARTVPVLRDLGVEVVNCTPGSRLTCYPSKPLAEVLP